MCMLSRFRQTLWAVTRWAPLTMGFSRQLTLERIAIAFSGGSSRPRDQTCVSCTASGFFTTEPGGKPLGNSVSV